MKCRRAGRQALPSRQTRATSLEDDEDEDYVPDTADDVQACGHGLGSSAYGSGPKPLGHDGAQDGGEAGFEPADLFRFSSEAQPKPPNHAHTAFNHNSDPPGDLLGYMAADSELPAPAAPPRDTAKRLAAMATTECPKPEGMWMHPDPVGPTSGPSVSGRLPATVAHPQASGHAAAVVSGMAWNSTISIFGPHALAAESSATVRDSPAFAATATAGPSAAAATATGLSAPQPPPTDRARGSDGSDGAGMGSSDSNAAELCMHLNQQQQQQLQQRAATVSPFADMAVAAAAGGWPVARAAAALLRGAATAAPLSLSPADPRAAAPAWLHDASAELDSMMHDMGILAGPGFTAQQLPAQPARPSALASKRPLTLPPPRPKRDLDSLLRSTGGTGSGTGLVGQASCCGDASGAEVADRGGKRLRGWPSLGEACGGESCPVASGAAAGMPMGAQLPPRSADGRRLNAIDCMPLDALLQGCL